MPCSFCSGIAHRITNCPNVLYKYKEEYLETITFEDFVIKMLSYKYLPESLKIKSKNISTNYKYLFDRYVNTTRTHYMEERDVLKLNIQIYTETRDSFGGEDEDTENETIYIMLPYQFNTEQIDLEKVKSNCIVLDGYIGMSTEYTIVQAQWIN